MRTRMQQLYSRGHAPPAVAESTMVMMWGVFWSVVAVYVILPYFNSGGNFDYADKVNFSAALGDPSAQRCRCSATTQAGNPRPAAHYRAVLSE